MSLFKKPRILIPIVGQGSVIYMIRTGLLDKISEFSTPVIAMLWRQDDLMKELASKGYTVTVIPAYEAKGHYTSLRAAINIWYARYVLKSPTRIILRKYLDLYLPFQKVWKRKIKQAGPVLLFALWPSYIKRLIKREAMLIKEQPCYETYCTWLEALQVDSLFTATPFLQEVELMARILKAQGKKMIASVYSFDNITTRQWPAIFFDHYITWNTINKNELERINPGIKNKNAISVCGAAQFDFHYNENFAWSKAEWLQQLGLPPGKKVILYAGGPVALFKDEPQYLLHLNEAFKRGQISASEAIILFRSHPLDTKERWQAFVGDSPYIIYDAAQSGKEKFDYTNVTEAHLRKLISTVKYADVQINFTSTMTIDGCVYHKPQIGPRYTTIHKQQREKLTRKMYVQEHYLPVTKSGAVHMPLSETAYIDMVIAALEHPENYTQHCDDCLRTMITYTDGRSTERAVAVLKKFYGA